MRILLLLGVCTMVACTGCSPARDPAQGEEAVAGQGREFDVLLTDPLDKDLDPVVHRVTQMLDSDGIPEGYRMRLVTGVCPQGICEMVDVTLYWDLFGNFERLKPSSSRPLTKQNHKPFSPGDHDRLEWILANRHSPLGRYPLSWFSEQPDEETGVDGVSGATELHAAAEVVEGAAYTTWVLWHWVNGSIVDQLKDQTRSSGTPELFRRLLEQGRPDAVEYVVERLGEREDGLDESIQPALFRALQEADHRTARRLLHLLGSTGIDAGALHLNLARISGEAHDIAQREILLFLKREGALHPEVLGILSGHLPDSSYTGVNVTLAIFEAHPDIPEAVQEGVRLLAQSENAFIARRVREYLENRNGGE